VLSVFYCLPALAEPVQRSTNEIISLALQRSAELNAMEKEADAKQFQALQKGSLSNPTMELEGVSGSLTGSPEERSLSFGINQEFSFNGKLRLKREAAEREAEVIRLQRENTARLLKEEVSTLVLDMALAAKRSELATELVKLNIELVDIAGERFKAGDIPELELNLARVELTRAKSRLLEIEREKTAALTAISALTGLDRNEVSVTTSFSATKFSQDREYLLKRALASRPDLRALLCERIKSETELRLAKAEALPNLTAGLFVQWQRTVTEDRGISSTGSDTQLGIRLSMPIPVFDRNINGVSAARVTLDAVDSRRLALERSITAEIETALGRFSSAAEIARLYQQGIIPQLTDNLKLTQEAYRLGEVGMLSVIDEQKKFFEVRDSYLTAVHAENLAVVKLESATATELNGGVQ
jgi:cobalt-zinc-cadmium efflux system outer membrane protein